MLRLRRSSFGLCCAGLTLALAGTGCSSIWARTRISDAESAVDAAAQAGAAKKATYDYTNALLYLEKAREEEAYSRFGPAIQLGELSTQYAEKARAVATGNAPAPQSTSASQSATPNP